jgi:hypothetical protein
MENSVSKLEEHISNLRIAEMQFRLASAVRLATTTNNQPLDVPTQWSHGKHVVQNNEIGLSPEDADYAAFFSATLMHISYCSCGQRCDPSSSA